MAIIYLITNQVNGKQYVGQTELTLLQRMKIHRSRSRHDGTTVLCRALCKHGHENFTIAEIETVPVAALDARESFWISELAPIMHWDMGTT